jgi:hypothetical protein
MRLAGNCSMLFLVSPISSGIYLIAMRKSNGCGLLQSLLSDNKKALQFKTTRLSVPGAGVEPARPLLTTGF